MFHQRFILCISLSISLLRSLPGESYDNLLAYFSLQSPIFGSNASEAPEDPPPKPAPEECGRTKRPMRITARHIEANGVGYKQGYTTLEGFFAPTQLFNDSWIPFVDLRGHIFNNGKWAANGGFGARWLTSSRIWGGNAYYDFRQTSHEHYNQVALGFESLGRVWDFRLNGYLPVGIRRSSYLGHAKFDSFRGHYAYLYRKYEFAMKGLNGEVGCNLGRYGNDPLFYIAGGPYYLEGRGKIAWGGQLRAALNITQYLTLEGNVSYDNAFKFISQGQIGLTFPFGHKRKIKWRKNSSCSQERALAARMLQRVDRFEIIPLNRKRHTTKAIDPMTGKPYVFWFVNNTSHSKGTFTSPFPTLAQAQNDSSSNDVIYVYVGDGTSMGMNQGIILKTNQRLFGAGIDQILQTTLGLVTIPAQGKGNPVLDNTAVGGATVTLASSNELSGLLITSSNSSGTSIIGSNINGAYIHNNNVNASGNGVVILLSDCAGDTVITNNTVFGPAADTIAVQYLSPAIATLTITNNQVKSEFNSISVIDFAVGRLDYCISNNIIQPASASTNSVGIEIENDNPSGYLSGTIEENVFSTSFSVALEHLTGNHQVEFLNNTAINDSVSGFDAEVSGGIFCLGLKSNVDAQGYSLTQTGGTFNLESPDGAITGVQSQNSGTITTSGTIVFVPEESCACGNPCNDIVE